MLSTRVVRSALTPFNISFLILQSPRTYRATTAPVLRRLYRARSGHFSCRSTAGFEGQQSGSGHASGPAVSFEIQRIPGDGSCLFRALAAGAHLAYTGALACVSPRNFLVKDFFSCGSSACHAARLRAKLLKAEGLCTGEPISDGQLLRAGFVLRQEVCAEMLARRAEIEPFITRAFDAYVSNMAVEGIWGGLPCPGTP